MRTKEERLASYKANFLEKVKTWKWDEPEERPCKKRGRKAKEVVRHESRPRTKGEEKASKQKSKYNWL
jgi:hypothetical protein